MVNQQVTLDVLEKIKKEGNNKLQQAKAHGFQRAMQMFDFIFLLHLMRKSLLITNDLSQILQKKNQDIVNAMCLVKTAKARLQIMRDSGWEELLKDVCVFCLKHNIKVSNMEDPYYDNPRHPTDITNMHYYRVNMLYSVINLQLQELNDRFTEMNTELLMCMSCLDPKNCFSSFDKDRLIQLAQFYPSDFNEFDFSVLASQLENYYMDVQDDRHFLEVDNLDELSQKMVETNKHDAYLLVYKLIKLSLILPLATASVERVFSAMNLVKTKLRSKMGDQWMNDCLVTFIERGFFINVDKERILQRFQKMKSRRGKLPTSA